MFNIPFTKVYETRQISAENPTGERGKAGIWDKNHPELTMDHGKGLKVHPFLTLEPGETAVLADIEGPGCINEFFITTEHIYLSELVLRIYWDDEEFPSVQSPLGSFFANGFDEHKHAVNSLPVVALPRNAYSCYWQMPFRKRARVTLTHDGTDKVQVIAYRILYKLQDVSEDAMYFHAQYRRSMTDEEHPVYTIADNINGSGYYVGTYLAWNSLYSGWWGEGEVKFYIDEDTVHPSMADNGTEDYFGGSFGFSDFNTGFESNHEQTYSTNFLGFPLAVIGSNNSGRKFSLYRWHMYDAIGFQNKLKVTVDTLGWWPVRDVSCAGMSPDILGKRSRPGYRPIAEDISSVAYWYQHEDHAPFDEIVPVDKRWDR